MITLGHSRIEDKQLLKEKKKSRVTLIKEGERERFYSGRPLHGVFEEGRESVPPPTSSIRKSRNSPPRSRMGVHGWKKSTR